MGSRNHIPNYSFNIATNGQVQPPQLHNAQFSVPFGLTSQSLHSQMQQQQLVASHHNSGQHSANHSGLNLGHSTHKVVNDYGMQQQQQQQQQQHQQQQQTAAQQQQTVASQQQQQQQTQQVSAAPQSQQHATPAPGKVPNGGEYNLLPYPQHFSNRFSYRNDSGGYQPQQSYPSSMNAHTTQVPAAAIRVNAPATPPQQDTGSRVPSQPQTMQRPSYMGNPSRNGQPQQPRAVRPQHPQMTSGMLQYPASQMNHSMLIYQPPIYNQQQFGATAQMQTQIPFYTPQQFAYYAPGSQFVPTHSNPQRPNGQNPASAKLVSSQPANIHVATPATAPGVVNPQQQQMAMMGPPQSLPHQSHMASGAVGATSGDNTLKQKRKHALTITDPNTGADVVESFWQETGLVVSDDAKESAADGSASLQPDPQTTQITMMAPPDILNNPLAHQQQQQQFQQQQQQQHLSVQDMGLSTPVVSANSDGPSIDIIPKQPLHKNKKTKNLEQVSLDSSNKSSDNSQRQQQQQQQTGAGETTQQQQQQQQQSSSIYQSKSQSSSLPTSSSGDAINYAHPAAPAKDEPQTKPTIASVLAGAAPAMAEVVAAALVPTVTDKSAHELPKLDTKLPQVSSEPKTEVSIESTNVEKVAEQPVAKAAPSAAAAAAPTTAPASTAVEQVVGMKMEKLSEVVKSTSTMTATAPSFVKKTTAAAAANGGSAVAEVADVAATSVPVAGSEGGKNNKKSNRNLLNNNSNLTNNNINKPSIVETDKSSLNANRIESSPEKLDYAKTIASDDKPTKAPPSPPATDSTSVTVATASVAATSGPSTTSSSSSSSSASLPPVENVNSNNSISNRSSISISNSSSSTSIGGKLDAESSDVPSNVAEEQCPIVDDSATSDLTSKMNKLNIINSNILAADVSAGGPTSKTKSLALNNNNNNNEDGGKFKEPPVPTATKSDIGNNNSVDIMDKLKSSRNEPNEAATKSSATPPLGKLMNYREDQWRPDNQEGRKFYTRDQMLLLMGAPDAQQKPKDLPEALKTNKQSAGICMPKFASIATSQQRTYPKRASQQGPGGGGRDGGMIGMGGGSRSQQGQKIIKVISLHKGVELDKAENAWKPKRLAADADLSEEDKASNEVVRQFRSILNKLTPENFEKLVLQVHELPINTLDRLMRCIELVFEKAISEPIFSVTYAQLCQRVSSRYVPLENAEKKSVTFKNLLITQCQNEFTAHGGDRNRREAKLKVDFEKETDPAKREEMKLENEEAERKIRRRAVGTVRFIGELFKIEMLTIRIMNQCIMILFDYSDEDSLECLCKLLTTIGKRMENEKPNGLAEYFVKLNDIVVKKTIPVCSRIRFMIQDVIDLRRNNWTPRRSDLNPKTMGQIQKDLETEHMNSQMINYNTPNRKNDDRRDRGGGGGGGGGGGYKNQQNDDGWKQQNTNNRNRQVGFDPSKISLSMGKIDGTTTLGSASMYQQWNRYASLAPTDDGGGSSSSGNNTLPMSGNKNKEPYHSKGSLEGSNYNKYRDDGGRSGGGSRTGSQIRSRENSNSRNVGGGGGSRSLQPPNRSSHSQNTSQPQQSRQQMYSSGAQGAVLGRIQPFQNQSSQQSSQPVTKIEFSEDTCADYVKKIKTIISDYVASGSLDTAMLNEIANVYHASLITKLHDLVIDQKDSQRACLGRILAVWLDTKKLSVSDCVKGLSEFYKGSIENDIVTDIPKFWTYAAVSIDEPLHRKLLTLADIKVAARPAIDSMCGGKFLSAVLSQLSKQHGPNVTRDIWTQSKCKWEDFVEGNVDKFIKENSLDFIINSNAMPAVGSSLSKTQLGTYLREALTKGTDEKEIIDYLKTNVKSTTDKEFIHTLTTAVIQSCIDVGGKYNSDAMEEKGITILLAFTQSSDSAHKDLQPYHTEIEVLNAVHRLLVKLQHPGGLAHSIFVHLYECEVVNSAALLRWRSVTADEPEQGVTVRSCHQLFLEAEKEQKRVDKTL